MEIRYEHASEKYAESFGAAVDAVARERKYLAATTGFPPESTLEFVREGERIDARKLDGRYDNLVLMGLKL